MSAQLSSLLLLAAALVFVYYRTLLDLAHNWWTDENYSHGLLVPLLIGYMLWLERGALRRTPLKPSRGWGGAGVGAAFLMLWAGVAGAELYLQRLSLVLMLAAITVYCCGWAWLRRMFAPLAVLWLALPIPAIILNQIAFPLQLFASKCAVWAMQLFEIPVLRQGNVIELLPLGATATRKLEVVEACSGIRSLMSLLTLAVVFAYFTLPREKRGSGGSNGKASNGDNNRATFARPHFWRSYAFWRTMLLVALAIPIAILTNALRVSGTGVLARYYGMQVAEGFFHTFSGWLIYVAAFVLLLTVGWLIERIYRRFFAQRGGGNDKNGAPPVARKTSDGGQIKANGGQSGNTSEPLPTFSTEIVK